jgi:hypothetical protein
MTPFHILFKMTLTYQPGFLHYFFTFQQLYKTIPLHCVLGDYKHYGNQTPQKEYFVLEYFLNKG